jgi:hypothetical protein
MRRGNRSRGHSCRCEGTARRECDGDDEEPDCRQANRGCDALRSTSGPRRLCMGERRGCDHPPRPCGCVRLALAVRRYWNGAEAASGRFRRVPSLVHGAARRLVCRVRSIEPDRACRRSGRERARTRGVRASGQGVRRRLPIGADSRRDSRQEGHRRQLVVVAPRRRVGRSRRSLGCDRRPSTPTAPRPSAEPRRNRRVLAANDAQDLQHRRSGLAANSRGRSAPTHLRTGSARHQTFRSRCSTRAGLESDRRAVACRARGSGTASS